MSCMHTMYFDVCTSYSFLQLFSDLLWILFLNIYMIDSSRHFETCPQCKKCRWAHSSIVSVQTNNNKAKTPAFSGYLFLIPLCGITTVLSGSLRTPLESLFCVKVTLLHLDLDGRTLPLLSSFSWIQHVPESFSQAASTVMLSTVLSTPHHSRRLCS